MFKRKYGFFMKVFRKCHRMIRTRALRRADRAGIVAVWAMVVGLIYAGVMCAVGEMCQKDARTLAYASIFLPIAYDWLIWRQVRAHTEIPLYDDLRRDVSRMIDELPETMELDDWFTLYRLGNAVIAHKDDEVRELLADMDAMPAFRGWEPLELVRTAFFGR